MVPVNFIAILVAAISNMIIGALWYSPILFVKEWMKLTGRTNNDMKKTMVPKNMLVMFIAALSTAYVMSFFVYYVGARDWMDGLKVGILAWLGFTAMTSVNDYLFSGRPVKLFVLNSAYLLVVLAVMGAVIATLSY